LTLLRPNLELPSFSPRYQSMNQSVISGMVSVILAINAVTVCLNGERSDGENCSKSSWKRNYRLMRRSVSANQQTNLNHPFIPVVAFLLFSVLMSCCTLYETV